MGWTYNTNLTTEKDQVRFYIGDTDVADPQFQDEELAFLLTTYGSVGRASYQAVKSLIAKYARKVTKEVGDLKIAHSDRVKQYKELLDSLAGVAGMYGVPSAPGIFKTNQETNASDDTLVQPQITMGMHDNNQ